jgi:hypothetical protein
MRIYDYLFFKYPLNFMIKKVYYKRKKDED